MDAAADFAQGVGVERDNLAARIVARERVSGEEAGKARSELPPCVKAG